MILAAHIFQCHVCYLLHAVNGGGSVIYAEHLCKCTYNSVLLIHKMNPINNFLKKCNRTFFEEHNI